MGNKSVEQLLLSRNNINDDVVMKTAHSLCKLSELKFLDLENNSITKESADALATVISNNTKLEELYLHDSQLQSGIIIWLHEFLHFTKQALQ